MKDLLAFCKKTQEAEVQICILADCNLYSPPIDILLLTRGKGCCAPYLQLHLLFCLVGVCTGRAAEVLCSDSGAVSS